MKIISLKLLHAILPLALILLLNSCLNDEGGPCMKGRGAIQTLQHDLPAITGVSLNDGLHLHILSGPSPGLQVEGGKNLIGNVRFEIEEGTLKLYDDNRCHWLRSAENLQLTLTVPNLQNIDHQGYGNISSGLLAFAAISVNSTQATGNIQLHIENEQCAIVSNGDGDILLSGTTDKLSAGYYHTRGKLVADGLVAKEAIITNDGYSEMHVLATDLLRVIIKRNGPVYYYQEPVELITTQQGSGKIMLKR